MTTKRTPNAEIGKVGCAHCGRQASVRRNSAGKLYYLCNGEPGAPGCGMITPNLPGGQAWMARNMTAAPAAPEAPTVTDTPPSAPKTDHQAPAAPVNVNEQPPPAAPVEETAPAPGFFSQILNTRIV